MDFMNRDDGAAQGAGGGGEELDEIQLAFRLAYFIHSCLSDEARYEAAKQIAMAALRERPVVAKKQRKRGYYRPKGQPSRSPDSGGSLLDRLKGEARSKIFLEEIQLLQHLVFKVSEGVEREQETGTVTVLLSQEDMLRRYLAYLVSTTIDLSAFYVTLGLCRLVYNYDAGETERLYEVITQRSSNRDKDSTYFRKQKAELIKKMLKRFGNRLRLDQGKRGEVHFAKADEPEQFFELLTACLDEFKPWGVGCCLPQEFSTFDVSALRSDSGRDDSGVELKRIHSLLHLECFSRLVKAEGFEEPLMRLGVPMFYPPDGGQMTA
jgi:hypothetical protein